MPDGSFPIQARSLAEVGASRSRRFIDLDDVRRLAAAGRTQTEIGAALGFSAEYLGRVAFREGIKIQRQAPSPRAPNTSPFWLLRDIDLEWLVEEAGCTSGEAADCLGISRGAVIGRANRMGLQWKRSPTTKPRPIAPQIEFPGFGNCVYPTGHVGAADFHFCGEMVEDISKPYCPTHVAKCYLPARQVATEASS